MKPNVAVILGILLAGFASPVLAETWHPYSRTATTAFLAEVDGIVVTGSITMISVASVPRRAAAGDRGYSVETFEFQCASGRWRTAGMVEFGPDGAEAGAYPEADAEWEPVRPNTNPDFLKRIACDGDRASPPLWPTVAAYIDAGRP